MGMNRGLWELEKEVFNSWEELGEFFGGGDLVQEFRSMSLSFLGGKDILGSCIIVCGFIRKCERFLGCLEEKEVRKDRRVQVDRVQNIS